MSDRWFIHLSDDELEVKRIQTQTIPSSIDHSKVLEEIELRRKDREERERHGQILVASVQANRLSKRAIKISIVAIGVAVLTLIVCAIGYWDQIVRFVRACRFWLVPISTSLFLWYRLQA